MAIPLSSAEYYDLFPNAEHAPGDVWVGLPTFGILSTLNSAGLVITPACDLTNRKVETITYVPIVSVTSYITSRGFLPEIKRAVEGQLEAAGLSNLVTMGEGFTWPTKPELTAAIDLLSARIAEKLPTKTQAALTRALSGLRILAMVCGDIEDQPSLKHFKELLGDRAFGELLKRIITNARSDIHFLPADQQRPDWSGIPVHSVALFRFPLTLPIEVLDTAQRVREPDWTYAVLRLRGILPCVDAIPTRPMKRLRVRPQFASDLLTRYTAMFGRLGSPDFTTDTVARFVNEIQESA